MRTEDLIADLATRATPVRPLLPPGTRTAAWMLLAMASAGAGALVFGLRPGVDVLAGQAEFIFTALLALATVFMAARVSLVLAIPGAERSAAERMTTIAVIAIWAGTMIAWTVRAGHGLAGVSDWYVCFVRVMAMALLPAIVLTVMIRRAAALRPGWTGALAFAAAASTGALAIQFICPVTDAGHALLGHFGPLVAAIGMGAAGARRLLRPSAAWSRRPLTSNVHH